MSVENVKICKRCGKEFTNPVPEVAVPTGITEIATTDWCADCNKFAMSIVYRWSSAYADKRLVDPLKGGR